MAKFKVGRGAGGGSSGGSQMLVELTGVSELVARLKELDPKLITKLRKDLRGVTTSVANDIKSNINSMKPPISGMGNMSYREAWGGAVTGVSISLAGNRRRDVTPLLKIKVDAPKTAVGYLIAENAGKRGGAGETPQGSNLIAVLTDRLGVIRGRGKGAQRQIAWALFWRSRLKLNAEAYNVVQRYEKIATGELNA
jgi:hypothetical protein